MGSKFVEKHKRKSILAALLLIFQGRAKYVAILLVVAIMSVPFVISGETLGRIIELRPVASFLRSVGMGSVVSAVNPKYSNDLMRAALEKAAEDSKAESFWNKFLKSVNATLPPAGSPSSMAMIRGGADLLGEPELKGPVPNKPGQVKGVVNEQERERGEAPEGVDLESMLAAGRPGGEGAGEGSGLYGDLMGQNLAGRFEGGGSFGSNSPYVGGALSGGGLSASGRSSGMFSSVMDQASGKVPVPGKPQKVNTKRMGRVSGFTWRNVGYKTQKNKIDVQMGNKKPMFQLAQTFAMTASAFKSRDSAPEYQAAYTGSTYDGNDVNAEAIQTDASAPALPDSSYTGDLMTGVQGMQDAARTCSDAQGTHGAKMSEDGKLMDDTAKTLGKPPKCCDHGAVDAWNGKIDRIISYCNDFNVHEAQLAAACQNKSSPMDCSSYNGMHQPKCSKWRCWLGILAALLMMLAGLLLLGTGLGVALLAAGIGMLVAQLVPGVLGQILGFVAGLMIPGLFFANVAVSFMDRTIAAIVSIGSNSAGGQGGE